MMELSIHTGRSVIHPREEPSAPPIVHVVGDSCGLCMIAKPVTRKKSKKRSR
jgi:hypothetical protein